MPQLDDNPRLWFAAADAMGDGMLSRREVELALIAQYPLDASALSKALDEHWGRWDHDGSGMISASEFVAPDRGLLAYARKYLLARKVQYL